MVWCIAGGVVGGVFEAEASFFETFAWKFLENETFHSEKPRIKIEQPSLKYDLRSFRAGTTEPTRAARPRYIRGSHAP